MIGIGVLGAVLLLTAIFASLVASSTYGVFGIYACLTAFVVCWMSGSLALVITVVTTGGIQAVSGMFLAMAVRTGLPLGFGILANSLGGPLANAGLFGIIVVHYLVGLLAETSIAVKMISTLNQRISVN